MLVSKIRILILFKKTNPVYLLRVIFKGTEVTLSIYSKYFYLKKEYKYYSQQFINIVSYARIINSIGSILLRLPLFLCLQKCFSSEKIQSMELGVKFTYWNRFAAKTNII